MARNNLQETVPFMYPQSRVNPNLPAGVFLTPVKDIKDWGNITEITDKSGKRKKVEDVIANNPNYEIYVDIEGNPLVGRHSPDIDVKTSETSNPKLISTPGVVNNNDGVPVYVNREGYLTHTSPYGSQAFDLPIEQSNDLFYLVAPALGLEDVIVGKGTQWLANGIGKGVRSLRGAINKGRKTIVNAKLTKQLNRQINKHKFDNIIDKNNIINNTSKQQENELTDLISFPFEEGQTVKLANKFNLEDVKARKINALSEEGYFITPEQRKILSSNVYNKAKPFYDKDINDSWYGYVSGITMGLNKSRLKKDIKKLYETLIHEGEHFQANEYATTLPLNSLQFFNRTKQYYKLKQQSKGIRAYNEVPLYTPKEQVALDEAYSFTDEVLENADISFLAEKAATNREVRALISHKYGDVTGKELDDIIDNMSNGEIAEILDDVNGYGRDFMDRMRDEVKNLSKVERKEYNKDKFNKIRHSLKYVGAVSPILMYANYDDYNKNVNN